MYAEWPVFQRCCFCLPLRRGILVLAYFDLVLGAIEYGLPMFGSYIVFSLHRDYMMLPFQLTFYLFVLDKIATIVLIIGLHMKRSIFIKIYYYFMIATLLSSVVLTIIDISLMEYVHHMISTVLVYVLMTVCSIYLVLLVRSYLKKLEEPGGNSFGNRLAEVLTPTYHRHVSSESA